MLRCVVAFALIGCSQPRTEAVTREPSPAPPPASEAIVTSRDAAAPGFSAFTPPPPIESPGPPTPADKACRKDGAADTMHERMREVAALDAALRKQGGMVLPAYELADERQSPAGEMIRGARGERAMIVAVVKLCSLDQIPLVGLSSQNEVFIARPDPKPAKQRTVTLCEPICGGCGRAPSPTVIVAEVPDGARFAGERTISFPIDVRIELAARATAKPCARP